jgi:hypothetical protein
VRPRPGLIGKTAGCGPTPGTESFRRRGVRIRRHDPLDRFSARVPSPHRQHSAACGGGHDPLSPAHVGRPVRSRPPASVRIFDHRHGQADGYRTNDAGSGEQGAYVNSIEVDFRPAPQPPAELPGRTRTATMFNPGLSSSSPTIRCWCPRFIKRKTDLDRSSTGIVLAVRRRLEILGHGRGLSHSFALRLTPVPPDQSTSRPKWGRIRRAHSTGIGPPQPDPVCAGFRRHDYQPAGQNCGTS